MPHDRSIIIQDSVKQTSRCQEGRRLGHEKQYWSEKFDHILAVAYTLHLIENLDVNIPKPNKHENGILSHHQPSKTQQNFAGKESGD